MAAYMCNGKDSPTYDGRCEQSNSKSVRPAMYVPIVQDLKEDLIKRAEDRLSTILSLSAKLAHLRELAHQKELQQVRNPTYVTQNSDRIAPFCHAVSEKEKLYDNEESLRLKLLNELAPAIEFSESIDVSPLGSSDTIRTTYFGMKIYGVKFYFGSVRETIYWYPQGGGITPVDPIFELLSGRGGLTIGKKLAGWTTSKLGSFSKPIYSVLKNLRLNIELDGVSIGTDYLRMHASFDLATGKGSFSLRPFMNRKLMVGATTNGELTISIKTPAKISSTAAWTYKTSFSYDKENGPKVKLQRVIRADTH